MSERHPFTAAAAVFLLLTGCAGLSSTVPADVVEAWRQRPYERGMLATGVVTKVERVHFQRAADPPKMLGVPGPVPPVVLGMEAIRNADWVYRTHLRMKDGTTRVLDLKNAFAAGDCVAFRPGLTADDPLPIPALPGECG